MPHKVLLFLGAGGNVGASSVALFKSKGYKVASVARTIREKVKAHSDMVLTADFRDPSVIKGIFEKVEEQLGVPNIVVYNREYSLSLIFVEVEDRLRNEERRKESKSELHVMELLRRNLTRRIINNS